MKGKKTGGRVRRNEGGEKSKRIFHTPSQAALDAYTSWPNKAQSLDRAIIEFNQNIEKK